MRFTDAAIINAVANIPEVSRMLSLDGSEQEFDFSQAIAVERNIFLQCDGGFAICEWSAPAVYQCHLLFEPGCKGKRAVQASRDMGDYMLGHHANMLWGQPLASNRAACWHIRQAGFSHVGNDMTPIGEVSLFVRES